MATVWVSLGRSGDDTAPTGKPHEHWP